MLSEQSLKKIDLELAKYPTDQRRSALMSVLRILQEELGFISPPAMQYVADYLKIPATWVMEVATFYGMYNLKPVGKYKIAVCTNLPCALQGGVNTLEYLLKKLDIKEIGGTSLDGRFTLVETECLGACGDAPVFLLNNHKMCSFMHEAEIDKKLAELN